MVGKANNKNKWTYRLVFLFLIIRYVDGATEEFGDPPFYPGPPDERVDFGKYENEYQIIAMEEEIPDKITIAYLNYEKESPAPKISKFDEGSNENLGAVFEFVEVNETTSLWALIITEKQDYENELMQKYKFDIKIKEEKQHVVLEIINIVDNYPIVVADKSSCRFEEGKIGETDCTYKVRDPDGFIDDLEYNLIEGPAEYFEVVSKRVDKYNSELRLDVKNPLNYDEYSIHLFQLEAVNVEKMAGTATVVVEVAPVRPPKWNQIFATKTFDEKSPQKFPISAYEVDNKIDEKIYYHIVLGNEKENFFHIKDKEKGIIDIDSMDRDALKKEIFDFSVYGCKASNKSSCCEQNIVIILNDINDHSPEVTVKTKVLEINEEEFWEFTEPIVIDDIDLAGNAQYRVSLEDDEPIKGVDWSEAFSIIPTQGYQRGEFKLVILDAPKLDFEVPEWQNIKLKVIATELEDPAHIGIGKLEIKLLNLNDEEPIFENNGLFKVEFKEDIPKKTEIVLAKATDRDIGDSIEYSLSASSQRAFSINKKTGQIKTLLDKSLDHEIEKEMTLQVYAKDTFIDGITNKIHTTQASVIITVVDVNDKTPTLTTDSKNINIVENTKAGTPVEAKIEAYDPDSKALLTFKIEWESSWATKLGRTVEPSLFKNCLRVDFKDDESNNKAVATLVVEKPNPESSDETIDFEEYEVLYLVLNVTDENQEINQGWATATIPIYIVDLNDNEPVFDQEITDQLKIVKDKAEENTYIGRVYAVDADGPEFNYVTYYLKEEDDTPKGLVVIDKHNGEIRVSNSDEKISCDFPDYFVYLNYSIIATDCENREGVTIEPCFETQKSINVSIEDFNDQIPYLVKFLEGNTVSIKEKSKDGEFLNQIEAFDKDRDEIFSNVSFEIDSKTHPEIQNLFEVNEEGSVYVKKLGGKELDRDFGQASYTVYMIMYDNVGGVGQTQQSSTSFQLNLIDINDQIPTFDSPAGFVLKSISENSKQGDMIDTIHAYDNDDPNTLNTKVNYGLDGVKKLDSDEERGEDCTDLFEVSTDDDNINGFVQAKKDLKNCFGTYLLDLTVEDIGEKGEGSNSNHQEFKLNIEPYNYGPPTIIFPKDGDQIVLRQPDSLDGILEWYDGRPLEIFSATDNHNGTKWKNMDFKIDPDEIFKLETSPGQQNTKLKLLKLPEKPQYDCALTAIDNGYPPEIAVNKFSIYFVNDSISPSFNDQNHKEEFKESTEGLKKSAEIPEADDPFGSLIIGKEIFYYIIDGDKANFILDRKSRNLRVNPDNLLDYQVKHFYNIDVVATYSDKPPSAINQDTSILHIKIKVLGENLHPPKFNLTEISHALTTAQEPGALFTLAAYDVDANETLEYELVQGSIEAHHPSLEKDKDKTFSVTKQTGDVNLDKKLQPDMEGYYTFTVKVYDTDKKHWDEAKVSVYVISDASQVVFKFFNTVEEVQNGRIKIQEILSEVFESNCGVDNIYKDVDEEGQVLENKTRVFTHFLDGDIPVNAEIINAQANDVDTYISLTVQFKEVDLIFDSAYKDQKASENNSEKLLQTTLIIVSTVLATLCILLFVGFTVRTRSLTQRLERLSTTKFGSQSSNLNRLGAPLPNTNHFAVDGSNPVWNENVPAHNIDTRSTGSGDSELVGVEDNITFSRADLAEEQERRASFNPVMRDMALKRPSANPMANPNSQDITFNMDHTSPDRY